MPRKNARKPRKPRTRAADRNDRLLRTVAEYVEHHGGSVIIAGPVSLMRFPDDREHIFHVVVRCLGRAPIPPKSAQ